MVYLSQKEKPYWYKARRVFKGSTSKGEPYTFISISHKDKQDNDQYKNATLYVWDDVDIDEGDSVAIYAVSGVNYKVKEDGFKKYIDMQISATRIKVKPADEAKAPVEPKQGKANKPAPQQSASKVETDSELYGGDDDLPF